jgi:hypothetical protein
MKSAMPILPSDEVRLGLCYNLDHYTCAIQVFFCHDIKQDQTEILAAAGVGIHARCQYCAT